MARQRFIWPAMWDDPDLAGLPEGAHLLYIASFSLADDDGRIDGNPVFLQSQAFPYRKVTVRTVKRWRDEIATTCSNYHIYVVERREYVQFLNWPEFQKPKYPSPSKLPEPPGFSRNGSGNWFRNDSSRSSGNDSSMGRDGLGWVANTELDPKAAAEVPKEALPRLDSQHAENGNEPNGESAAAEEAPRDRTIREACTRYGADIKVVEPLAWQLTADSFQEITERMSRRLAKGNVKDTPAHFVFLLQAQLKDQQRETVKAAFNASKRTIEQELYDDGVAYANAKDPRDVCRDLTLHKLKRLKIDEPEHQRLIDTALLGYDETTNPTSSPAVARKAAA